MEGRPIPGFEDYRVTKDGRIISTKGRQNKVMSQQENGKGYLLVTLSRDGEQYRRRVHRLVLKAFSRRPKGDEETRHLDGNPKNNNLRNLKWGTPSENKQDALRMGRRNNSKLEEFDVKEIRRKYVETDASQYDLADEYGVTRSYIGKIVRNEKWTDI